MSGPRYPEVQDRNEHGLALLRAQYERLSGLTGVEAGRDGCPIHLYWGSEVENGKRVLKIYGSGLEITMVGSVGQIADVGTVICRAVDLGWHMLNELEPKGA